MTSTTRRAWAEIDLSAVRENIRRLRQHCAAQNLGRTIEIMPAVKADAYGHGAVAVAKTLLADCGIKHLAVANAAEGEQLRRKLSDYNFTIQILGALLLEEIPVAVENDLICSVHDLPLAENLNREAIRQNRQVKIHLKIDTGMGRLGVLPSNVVKLALALRELPNLIFTGAFMHFAAAENSQSANSQIDLFEHSLTNLRQVGIQISPRHAANSAALFLHPRAHYDLVRPGAAVYGFHDDFSLIEKFPLRPAMRWYCRLSQVKDYPRGAALGYGHSFIAARATRVGILPIGYADGYFRLFSNRASVLINGQRAPVIGRVSMDYTMIDLTDFPPLSVGVPVILLGESSTGEKISLEELSRYAETIPYEIACTIGHGAKIIRQSADEHASI